MYNSGLIGQDKDGEMTNAEQKKVFELLNNTIADQKVPVPDDKQQVDFDQERTDWYTIKPKKNLNL